MPNRLLISKLLMAAGTVLLIGNLFGQFPNCLGTSASDNPAARQEMDRGVEAYKGLRYSDAIDRFQKATNLAPCLTMTRQYLATAQAKLVVPGLNTPDNLKIADEAIANFQIVLTQDPHDVRSLKEVAAIYFAVKRLEDAREWQKKVLSEDPHDAEAAYTIGVIDWTEAHINMLKALNTVELLDDGEGNSKAPPEVLESIKQQNTALIEEALQYLTQAIADRPNYDEAMAYINLVYRRKADLDYEDPALRDEDVVKAREWAHRSVLIRKENEQQKLAQPDSAQPQ